MLWCKNYNFIPTNTNIYGNLIYCCYCNMSLVICSLKLTMFLICNKMIVSKNINFQIAQAEGNLENQKFFKILLALKMSGASIEIIATPNWYYCHLQKSFAFKIILIKFCSVLIKNSWLSDKESRFKFQLDFSNHNASCLHYP